MGIQFLSMYGIALSFSVQTRGKMFRLEPGEFDPNLTPHFAMELLFIQAGLEVFHLS